MKKTDEGRDNQKDKRDIGRKMKNGSRNEKVTPTWRGTRGRIRENR